MSNGINETGEAEKRIIRSEVLRSAREEYKRSHGNLKDVSNLTEDELVELIQHPWEPVNINIHPLKLALGRVRIWFSNIHFPQFQKREQKTENSSPLVKRPV